MRGILFTMMLGIVCLVICVSDVQAQSGRIDASASSEWEATGINNGRRIVRDSNGYFHAFWHSRVPAAQSPSGASCHIFYAYTTSPASEPPSMANKAAWSTAVNMTASLGNLDNRYPSVAITYDTYDGSWTTTNRIHVVWQAILPAGTRYEVLYAGLSVSSPPSAPAAWSTAANLSGTVTDSLVPSIAINQYSPNVASQHLHVMWQEEDINNNGGLLIPPAEDTWYSDILYTRSVNNGGSWAGPASATAWDNITNTPRNSQMPSVSCILDQYTSPVGSGKMPPDLGYNSGSVQVAYQEDTGAGGIHIIYLRSPNDGAAWNAPIDVSANTGAMLPTDQDAYPNLAVDMRDNPHITFMRLYLTPAEPLRSGAAASQYLAGINPSLARSFPGPDPGMYGITANIIVYCWSGNQGLPGTWSLEEWGSSVAYDNEFPTVALDRWQHVNVNWQGWKSSPAPGDYEIYRAVNINQNAPPPNPPIPPQLYTGFVVIPSNDSIDTSNDDLFPNLAHKKTGMYKSSNEALMPGYDEVWTKVTGHGPSAAIAAVIKQIWQDGDMAYDTSLDVKDWSLY